MKSVFYILINIFIFSSFTALAKGGTFGIGNGGDAIVCYTDSSRKVINSVNLFDYWEQNQFEHYPGGIDLGPSHLSVQEKIKIAADRVALFDPNLKIFILQNALNIADNIDRYLVSAYVLPEIDDANPKVVPTQPNCFIEQFAVQYKDVVTGQRRYSIAEKFFNSVKTSNNDRAGLILHEAIYRYALLHGQPANSDGIRHFNYAIATKKLNRMTEVDTYVALLNSSSLNFINCIKDPQFFGAYRQPQPNEARRNSACNIPPGQISYEPCYKQNLLLGDKVSVKVEPNQCISQQTNGSISFNTIYYSAEQNMLGLELKRNTGTSQMKAYSLLYNVNKKEMNFNLPTNVGAENGLEIVGPLKKIYQCSSEIHLDLQTDTINQCLLNSAGVWVTPKYFYSIKSLKNNGNQTWDIQMDYGYRGIFPLLGSKTGKSVVAESGTLDSQSRFIKGSVTGFLIRFTGSLYGIEYQYVNSSKPFVVTESGGVFILNYTTGVMRFDNPKKNEFSLINSGTSNPTNYCADLGYGKDSYSIIPKFVSGHEQFYDLATGKVVYKTDEEVEVITSITCLPTSVTVSDY